MEDFQEPEPAGTELAQEPAPALVQEPEPEPTNSYQVGKTTFNFAPEKDMPGGRPVLTRQDQDDAAFDKAVSESQKSGKAFYDDVFAVDNVLGEVLTWTMNPATPRDESFKWTGEAWGEAMKDVPEDYWHEMWDAGSAKEAKEIKYDILRRLEVSKSLSSYGGWGTVGRFGLAVTDPGFLAAMIATEGAAGAVLGRAILKSAPMVATAARGAKLGYTGRAAYKAGAHLVKSGARVGVGMGGVAALQAGLSPVVSIDDVPHAIMEGAVFGMGLSGLGQAGGLFFKRVRMPKTSEPHLWTREQFTRRNMTGNHEAIVEAALRKGDVPIPDHVLVDYPHLVGRYGLKAKVAQLLDQRAMRDLGLFNYERPMGFREYLGNAKDPFAPMPPGLFQRYKMASELRKHDAKLRTATAEFNTAKSAYEKAIGEPWEKAEPFLERQREATQNLEGAKQDLIKLEAKMESLRSSVDGLIKNIVETPEGLPQLLGKDVESIVTFLEYKFGGRSNTPYTSRGRGALGDLKLPRQARPHRGNYDVQTLRRIQKAAKRRLTGTQQKLVNEILDFEVKRLELLEGRMAFLEGELNTAVKADRVRGQKGARALDVARRRQGRKVMEVKAKRDAAHADMTAAKKAHSDFINGPQEKLHREYWESIENALAEDIRNGSPVPASSLERFPKLKEMEGARSYEDAAKAGEPMVKDMETVPSETIRDIEKLTTDESLVAIDPIAERDPIFVALEAKLLGPTWDMQTVKSLKVELRARGLRVSGNKQMLLDRLENFDRQELFGNYRDMQTLVRHAKKGGFVPTNKGRSAHDLKAQLEEFAEQVKNPAPIGPEAVKAAKVANAPLPDAALVADTLRAAKGLPEPPEKVTKATFDIEQAKRIAIEYEKMENNPHDPAVKEAYEQMGKELIEQYEAIIEQGYTLELNLDEFEPYPSSAAMLKDLAANKKMMIFSTENGFGQGGITAKMRAENPLLAETGLHDINGRPILVNDMFRFVHDFLGHGEKGNSFGPIGEETAWLVHSSLFSPKARRALTSETRGQNSWVNFNKANLNKDGSVKVKGDEGYVHPAKRPFAEQKIGLMPEWVSDMPAKGAPAPKAPLEALPEVDVMARIKAMYEGKGNKGVIFTSDNPMAVTASAEDNAIAMDRLLKELDDAGISYTRVKGKYTEAEDPTKAPMEDSILIEGLSEAESVALGAKYGQDSVLTPRGFMYTTGENAGKITPSLRAVVDRTGEDNSFSRVKTAEGEVSFRVELDWEAPKTTFDLPALLKKGELALKKRTDALKPPPPEPLVAAADSVVLARLNTNAPLSGMRRWRAFFGGKFFSSFNAEVGHTTAHPAVRWLGDNVLQDSIYKLDSITGKRVPSKMAGQTRAEMQTYGMFHELGEVYQASYAKWRGETGVTSSQRMVGEAEESFGALVADAVRGKKSADANVMAAAEGVRKTLKELDAHMLKEGLTEKLFDDPNYFPRKILPSRVAKLIVKAESGAVDKFVSDAIMKGHADAGIVLTQKEADALANVYLTNINTRHYAVDYQNNGFLGNNSAILLGEYLEKLGIEPGVRASILKKTRVSTDGESKGFVKHRMLLDEAHLGEVMGKDGTSFSVTMAEMFDNNAKRVMSTHIRQVHGAIESRRIGLRFNEMRGLSTAEQPLAATWTEMTQFINRTAIAEGRSPADITRINDQVKRMRELVGGYSTEKPSGLATTSRIMQKYAGASFGATFGMASLAELGQPMAHSSVKAFLSHASELPTLIRDLKAGKITGTLQQELAMLTGVGTEGRFFRELATMLEHHPLGEAGTMSKVETVVGNLQNGAFKLGLLTPIDAIQRQYAGMLFAQEMLNSALKGKSSYSTARLLQIGLTEETAESIFNQMRLHAKYEGSGGNKLLTFNFKDWVTTQEGREAAASIQEAIVLHTRKVIHQTHAGQLPRIMQNPIGRLLFQFRNFTIGSYETQLLSNLQAADARAMASFSINTFFGLVSYLAITNVKFAGRPEELEKYLTTEEMAKGAFQRSGFATHFPALIDTIFQVGGSDAVFASGRSSGLTSGILSFDSTPVGSLADGLTGTAQGILAPIFSGDYQYSQQNFKKSRKIIPYHNAAGASYLLHSLQQAFPENSKEK